MPVLSIEIEGREVRLIEPADRQYERLEPQLRTLFQRAILAVIQEPDRSRIYLAAGHAALGSQWSLIVEPLLIEFDETPAGYDIHRIRLLMEPGQLS